VSLNIPCLVKWSNKIIDDNINIIHGVDEAMIGTSEAEDLSWLNHGIHLAPVFELPSPDLHVGGRNRRISPVMEW
jgi:hypothetical protein